MTNGSKLEYKSGEGFSPPPNLNPALAWNISVEYSIKLVFVTSKMTIGATPT
ncbi:MAG TPA: hypothetical protein PKI14_08315 [Fervidobacterium sp.]|nr:hypothetical protein [Fervidobacterium sp.]HPZ17973.1 hypothetical protein [Fervidobacterium sp.]HQE49111.1 hypothetical protein [Fervidobacterium sp.]HUM42937.1 hypothetical protein [Fervidobacterium sp.]